MLLRQLREAEPAPLLRHDPLDELLEAANAVVADVAPPTRADAPMAMVSSAVMAEGAENQDAQVFVKDLAGRTWTVDVQLSASVATATSHAARSSVAYGPFG